MAETHVYGGNTCYTPSCLDSQDGAVVQNVPVVFGEYGETYDASSCGSSNTSTILHWAQAHHVGHVLHNLVRGLPAGAAERVDAPDTLQL